MQMRNQTVIKLISSAMQKMPAMEQSAAAEDKSVEWLSK